LGITLRARLLVNRESKRKNIYLIYFFQRELKEGALNAVDSLRRELQEAKSELASLKSDNLVLARTRTIKTPFFKTGPLLIPQIQEYGNFSVSQTYIHFVALETSIIRKIFLF